MSYLTELNVSQWMKENVYGVDDGESAPMIMHFQDGFTSESFAQTNNSVTKNAALATILKGDRNDA